jgi:hypothetical protein
MARTFRSSAACAATLPIDGADRIAQFRILHIGQDQRLSLGSRLLHLLNDIERTRPTCRHAFPEFVGNKSTPAVLCLGSGNVSADTTSRRLAFDTRI